MTLPAVDTWNVRGEKGAPYDELDRGSDLWKQTEHSGTLAMHIAGEFPGLELEFWAVRG